MKKESCLKCIHVAYVLVNMNNIDQSLFYCVKNQRIFNDTEPCAYYQKKSRKEK